MPALNDFPRRFHDDENSDVESQASSIVALEEQPTPKWYSRKASRSCKPLTRAREWKQSSLNPTDPERRTRRKSLFRKLLIVFVVLACFSVIAAITYISLVGALIRRLNPPRVSSGLQHIVDNWKEPDANGAYQFEWRDDFSRDITPKNCHSHNDYWRSVPTYQALAAGCVSIEADIWLSGDNELLVSHAWRSTKKERTLQSLYLDPITNIFTNRNVSTTSIKDKEVGVFDTDPNASIILLIDFKSDGAKTWPVLISQLEPLHKKGWLTYFNGAEVVQGPLTIVGTGNTPFDLVLANTNRYIFFDAALDDVSNEKYTKENSYYASVQLNKAIGHIWLNRLTSSQVNTLKKQIKAAADKGLKSRYWDTPSWPISLRDKVWFTLTENDVGMLNVDDLTSATRWNWNWCVIAGLTLCGKS
ncbi:uncharacterized protein BDR25DRAFT_387595 [Lindgomyces ingoldianus]|uniref:Uncharacterized protein n=1 Tax=Lindgomyces ingoldianus TaxID=673940 RepID=A0ACB6R2Q8_9PLEO|nr:uncharacterized protein BDR25DRAFT_387595 [Lindgomyces ingoldianus]KAF2473385.1 hypothetical protein BDR25DRAFT_387595 [Lindgomyces ingoldianus]